MGVETRHRNGTLVVVLDGTWSMETSIPRFADAWAEAEGDVNAVAFEHDALGEWDSSLLAFVREALETCEDEGVAFREETLPDDVARLIRLSRAVPEQDVQRDRPPEAFVDRIGEQTLELVQHSRDFITFTGEFALSFGRFVTGRVRMRWRDFWVVVQSSSASALPIVTLISLLVGLILSFLGAVVLRRFGADYYVSYLVSYGMLRELGALMTAIIMAGRTGAAFAAEIGSMKITEEVDALKTLGLSPMDVLVLPRVVAVFIALPLLTIYADAVGIMGGLMVAVSMLDVTPVQFMTGLITPVTLADVLLGIFKGTVYGAIIGLAGCLRGMQTGNDASAVGDAATSAVVTGITLIVLANALIDWVAAILQI